jgi:hypothetical protein
MSIQLAIILCIVVMGLMSVALYYLGKRVSSRLLKYIPAIAAALGIVFFSVKLNFFPFENHAFEGIYDLVAINLLAVIFGISIIGAIVVEVISINRNKRI